MKQFLTTALLLLVLISPSFSQKVKYKDLYILLKAENYKDADPYLRIYLTANPDDPHANYSMGRMLQNYLGQGDLLNGSSHLKDLADSALIYYEKAYGLTTEKFVKKHDDDYYLEFRRRDMRTGKFEVKYSDVQYDMEGRTEEVKKFKSDLDLMLSHFTKAQEFYTSVQAMYQEVIDKAATINMLYFTFTIDDIDNLRLISNKYDSSMYHLNTYRSLMKGMGESAVEQEFVQKPIEKYPDDGLGETDFYASAIEYINYKEWVKGTIDIILKRIIPLKKRLISFDNRVRELHDNVVRDSLDKRDEVFTLATQNVGRDLREYQQGTLPSAIFDYRISEINYHSALNNWYQEQSTMLDIDAKLNTLEDFSKQIVGMKKLLERLKTANTTEQQKMFTEYIAAQYTDINGMNNFIVDQENTIEDDSQHLTKWISELEELDKIGIWGSDSISLIVGTRLVTPDSTSYYTILTDTLEERTIGFYALKGKSDELSLVFGVAPSNRAIDSLFSVPLGENVINRSLTIPEYIVDTVGVGKRLWMFNAGEINADSLYLSQLFITDLSTGLTWNKELPLPMNPTKFLWNIDSESYQLLNADSEVIVELDLFGEIIETDDASGEGADEGANEGGEDDKEKNPNEN